MDWVLVVGLGLAVLAGGVVQSTIGFGMAVVAAPVVVLLAPDLMPVALLVPALALPVLQLSHGMRDIAWRPLGWAMAARALFTPVGVAVVATGSRHGRSPRSSGCSSWSPSPSRCAPSTCVRPPRNAAVAGAVSGISGTAAAIGGPFLALVLQHERPHAGALDPRGVLLAGSLLGLGALAVGGELTREQLLSGLAWVPFVLLGYVVGAPVRARIDPEKFRRAVLAFCVLASITVIVRAALA